MSIHFPYNPGERKKYIAERKKYYASRWEEEKTSMKDSHPQEFEPQHKSFMLLPAIPFIMLFSFFIFLLALVKFAFKGIWYGIRHFLWVPRLIISLLLLPVAWMLMAVRGIHNSRATREIEDQIDILILSLYPNWWQRKYEWNDSLYQYGISYKDYTVLNSMKESNAS